MARSFRAGGTEEDPLFTEDVREPARETSPGWMESFRQQFSSPEARAALLQFGIAAMQPQGFGQSLAGQLGQAIGAGAEAAGRVQAEGERRRAREFEEEEKLFQRGQTERRTGALERRAARAARDTAALTRSQQLVHERSIQARIIQMRDDLVKAELGLVPDPVEKQRLVQDPAFQKRVIDAVRADMAQATSLAGEQPQAPVVVPEDEEAL